MKAWITKQLTDGKLDFAKLERIIWMGLIAVFQRVMVEVLEVMDRVLMASRDTERYEHRDKKGRTLQALVGSISFKRRYYWDHQERRYVFLLDQKLGLKSPKRRCVIESPETLYIDFEDILEGIERLGVYSSVMRAAEIGSLESEEHKGLLVCALMIDSMGSHGLL